MDFVGECKKNMAYVDLESISEVSDTTKNLLLESFNFLSPKLIIIHGSTISNKRYGTSNKSDIDIIIVSHKKNFWNLRELHNHFKKKYQSRFGLDVDITIVSPNNLIKSIQKKGNSSWYTSMCEGFSLIEVST